MCTCEIENPVIHNSHEFRVFKKPTQKDKRDMIHVY